MFKAVSQTRPRAHNFEFIFGCVVESQPFLGQLHAPKTFVIVDPFTNLTFPQLLFDS